MSHLKTEELPRRQMASPVDRIDGVRFMVRRRIAAAQPEQPVLKEEGRSAGTHGRLLAGSSIMRRVRLAHETEAERAIISGKEAALASRFSRPRIEGKDALPQILASLGDGVAAFCLTADVAEAGRWRALLPVSSSLLPDTMIDLDVCPLEIRLRFMTEHAISRNAIAAHLPLFRNRLRKAIPERCAVEVMLW